MPTSETLEYQIVTKDNVFRLQWRKRYGRGLEGLLCRLLFGTDWQWLRRIDCFARNPTDAPAEFESQAEALAAFDNFIEACNQKAAP